VGDTVTSADFDCRYIREGPYSDGTFSRFVKGLGINLPSDTTVRDAVKYGWATPTLRVELPREYFDDWVEFPLWSRDSEVRPEHRWADLAVRGEFALGVMFAGKGRLSGEWYLHPFDTDDPDAREILKHTILPSKHPEPFVHARGRTVYPFVDFFRYWEAYRLMETVEAAQLFQPIINRPAAGEAAGQILEHLNELVHWSNGRIEGVGRTYAAAAKTFEWVSLYRTLLGSTVHARGKRPNTRQACKKLLDRIGRDPEALRNELRDVLLELWHDWHVFGADTVARGAEQHLQQDIKRAVDFIATVSKTRVDYRDPRWFISDWNPRPWAQLHEALPFEHWLARESLARRASLYLRGVGRLRFRHPVPTTEEELRSAVDARWDKSYGLRRFAILFKRLHDLLGKDRDVLVTFNDRNVVDYMILGCLVVERMIAEWWRERNPKAGALPTLNVMLLALARELTAVLKVGSVEQLLKDHTKSTKLYALKRGDRLPLVARKPRTAREYVFITLHNLNVLRNYSAHHDCLDFELSYGREGARAMRTIVGAVSLVLCLPT
jgi:hypothetical protein